MTKHYKKRQSIWSDYWVKGVISSCSEAIVSEDSEVDLFWQTCAESIQATDTIMDLCTGKGAVIKTLLDQLREQDESLPQCYGVDFASYKSINNVGFKGYPENVKLFLKTSIEAIPLDDNSITHFVSQYGIEYSLTEKFYQEVARLLSIGGTLSAVLHHQDSVLCTVAKEEIKQVENIIDELKMFDVVNELSGYFALLKNPANAKKLNTNSRAMKLREEYNRKIALLREEASLHSNNSILQSAMDVFAESFQVAKTHGKKEAKLMLSKLKQELDDSMFRSKELLDAALDEQGIEKLISSLESKFKLVPEVSVLKSKHQIVAWGLRIIRL